MQVPVVQHRRLRRVRDWVFLRVLVLVLEGSFSRDQQGDEGSNPRLSVLGSDLPADTSVVPRVVVLLAAGEPLVRRRDAGNVFQRVVVRRRGGGHLGD